MNHTPEPFHDRTTRHAVDAEYRFGRPTVYLKPIELARLSLVRTALGETHAERVATAAGLPHAA